MRSAGVAACTEMLNKNVHATMLRMGSLDKVSLLSRGKGITNRFDALEPQVGMSAKPMPHGTRANLNSVQNAIGVRNSLVRWNMGHV